MTVSDHKSILQKSPPHFPLDELLNIDVDSLLADIKDLANASENDEEHKFSSQDQANDQTFEILPQERYFYSKCVEATKNKDFPDFQRQFFGGIAARLENCALMRPDRRAVAEEFCLPMAWGDSVSEVNQKLDQMILNINEPFDPLARNIGLGCEGGHCVIPTGLQGIWNYGCWCNFGTRLMDGQAHPVNPHDEICRKMQLCLRCARMDAVNDTPPRQCDPKTQSFVSAFAFGDVSLEAACSANNPDPCARDVCTCQMDLMANLVDLLWDGYIYDPAPRHISEGGSFDFDASCPIRPGVIVDVECCGKYPGREPYKVGSRRDCCVVTEELFNVYESHCCADGAKSIGEPCD